MFQDSLPTDTRTLIRRAIRNLLMLAAAIVAINVPAVYGCTQPQRATTPKLVVTSFATLKGDQANRPKIRIRFSAPAVPAAAVGRPLADPPAVVLPRLSVRAHWSDAQTLVLTPTEPLATGARYDVVLAGDLAQRSKQVRFHFVNRPLKLKRLSDVDVRRVPPRPRFRLHFDRPVQAADVAKHCFLTETGTLWPVGLVSPVPDRIAKDIPLTTRTPLSRNRRFVLRCAGLEPYVGGAPLTVRLPGELQTFPSLRVSDFGPSIHDYPPEEARLRVRFSTPVPVKEARRWIRIEPATKGVSGGWMRYGGQEYSVTLRLKPLTRYRVTVDSRLKDRFGQALGEPLTYHFTTGRPLARIHMERGIYAVEAGQTGYPVWTKNLDMFTVTCASVPRNKVVRLLTSSMSYDPWYSDTKNREVPWAKLGLRETTKRLAVPLRVNRWQLTHLEMNRMCGSKRKRGLYLASVRSAQVRPHPEYRWRHRPSMRVLANVTDLGVLTKIGPASGIVWVSSLKTGRPVSGARVAAYTPKGRKVFSGRTNAQGIAKLPGAAALLKHTAGREEWVPQRKQRLIVFVETTRDFAVVDGNWANGIQLWNFGVTVDRAGGAATKVRGFIQSDRGVYRPGETVHFKGLVREVRLGALPRVPRGKPVKIEVRDSRNQVVLRQEHKLTRFGGFAFDLALSKEARVGDYHVNATLAGQTFRERFVVQEFRKVTYEVKVRSEQRHVALGDAIKLGVKARYLFGAPVQESEIRWSVRRRQHPLRFRGYGSYTFTDHGGSGYFGGGYGSDRTTEFVTDGDGETDAKGESALSIQTTKEGRHPQDYLATVTVKDQADRTASKTVVVTAHPTDRYVGLHTQEYVQAVGMPFALNTVAVSPAGRRVALPAELHYIRTRYECTWKGTYRSYRTCERKQDTVWKRAVKIPATGTGVVRVYPKKPGEYILRLVAKDTKGRQIRASGSVWIIGRGEAFWSGDESVRMGLIASKRSYKPGETAKLVPRTVLTGATALVTLERNGVVDAFVTRLKGSGAGIRIPLRAKHAPNVYASVTLVTGRRGSGDRNRPRFQMGVINLPVSPTTHRLKVSIRPAKKRYEPGETVAGTVRVTDHAGRPVRAELSLSVADEGVLLLIGYRTPDPVARFFAPWGIGVDSATNWNRISRLNNPKSGDPDSGGDGGGGDDEPKVRSRFLSSAYWAPTLVTNAAGVATFRFKAPDNLTAFRMMAVAADAGHRFGKSAQRITITKDLLAKPVLPRFFSSGDRAEIGVVVHNHTGQAGTVTVTAKATGLSLTTRQKQARVGRDGLVRIRFPVSVKFARKATVQFSVRMGRFRDALRKDIPIQRPLAIDKKSLRRGRGTGLVALGVRWPRDTLTDDSYLEVTVDRTGLGEMRESLRYLIEYPYGCLEQTLSRFIPLAKVKDLAVSLGFAELQGPRLRKFLKAGADKVARHQHDNGLFSLWPAGRVYPHLSAYAMYGLLEAKRAGVAVDRTTLQRGRKALRAWANHRDRTLTPGGETATLAMTAYVLAELGHPDAGLNARLYEARRSLPSYGLAFLLRALHRAKAPAPRLAQVKKDLLELIRVQGTTAKLRERRQGRFSPDETHQYMSSDVRSSAIALSALIDAAPAHPVIPKLVAGLKSAQLPELRWRNTQENLFGLVAMSDWARLQRGGRTRVSVTLGGRALAQKTLRGSEVLSIRRSLTKLRPGQLRLRIQGGANYLVRLITARRARKAARIDRGFAVSRSYLDADSGMPVKTIKAGQQVRVVISLQVPKSRRWVAVVDRLPAGLEPVNPKLTSGSAASHARTGRSTNPLSRNTRWTHRELRDDRVLAFADHLGQGTHTLTYLARAALPGTFTAAPPHAEEMYAPETFGRGGTVRFTVQP